MASASFATNGATPTTGLGIGQDNFGRRQSTSVMRAEGIAASSASAGLPMYLDKPGESSRTMLISPRTTFPSDERADALAIGTTEIVHSSSRQRTREDTYRPSDRAVWRHDDDDDDDNEGASNSRPGSAIDFNNPSPFGSSTSLHRARVEAARKRLMAARDTLGASSQEAIRLRRDFRQALARANDGSGGVGLLDDDDNMDESMSAALEAAVAKPRAGTSAASSSGSRGPDAESDELRTLLAQARKLSLAPSITPQQAHTSSADGATLSDKVFGAIDKPSEGTIGGALTSASTPEGALGRITLPALSRPASHPDVPNDSDSDSLLESITPPRESIWPPPSGLQVPGDAESVSFQEDRRFTLVPSEEPSNPTIAATSTDTEALRAGLRFVLACYDDLSKRANDSKGLSNAIITSIAEGRSYQPIVMPGVSKDARSGANKGPRGASNGAPPLAAPLSSSATTRSFAQQPLRPRLRSGSILRAFARGKTASFFDGISGNSGSSDGDGGNKANRWGQRGSGLRSPSRTTQMDFDSLPGELVGPSTRLGMARVISWQETDDRSAPGSSGPAAGRGVQTDSGGDVNGAASKSTRDSAIAYTSPLNDRDSRISQNDDGSILSLPSITAGSSGSQSATQDLDFIGMSNTLKQAQRDALEARQDKGRLMREMEQLSEELFAQANELVKQERIKSSALEKERDKLKLALGGNDASIAKATKSSEDDATSTADMELGAQNESEAMMMAAVAQASRECAEAEEEAQGWRKHCEELEARIAILEEALYNAMAMLAEHEQPGDDGALDGVGDAWNGAREEGGAAAEGDRSTSTDVLRGKGERSGHSSSVMSNRDYSDSVSSFYSAGEENAARANLSAAEGEIEEGPSVDATVATDEPAETGIPGHFAGATANETETAPAVETTPQVETESAPEQDTLPKASPEVPPISLASVRRQSMMHIDDEVAEAPTDILTNDDAGNEPVASPSLQEPLGSILSSSDMKMRESQRLSFAQDAVSVASLSSHRSSQRSSTPSAHSPSRRESIVSSRRFSRSSALPPRLPEPSSPLPSLPGGGSNGNAWPEENALPLLRRPSATPSALSNEVPLGSEHDDHDEDDDFHDISDTVGSSVVSTPGLSSVLPSSAPEEELELPTAEDGVAGARGIGQITLLKEATTAITTKPTPAPLAEKPASVRSSETNGVLLQPRTPQLDVVRRHSLTPSSSGDSRRSNNSGNCPSDASDSGGMPRSRSTSYNLAALSPGTPPSRTVSRRNIMRGIETSGLITKTVAASPAVVEQAHEYDGAENGTINEPTWQSVDVESKVVRRRTIGTNGTVNGQRKAGRKTARSAILNHMPPAAPKGNASSIESIGGGLSSSKSETQIDQGSSRASMMSGSASSSMMDYGSFHSSKSTEGSLHDGGSRPPSVADTPPPKGRSVSGRRRRFNDTRHQSVARLA